MHRRSNIAFLAVWAGAVLSFAVPAVAVPGDTAEPTAIDGTKQVFLDPPDDMSLHRTDDEPEIPTLSGNWPEMIFATLGRWAPVDPHDNAYLGEFSATGGFLRLDLVFAGLLNPPGELIGNYYPEEYGPNPLIGWVDFDVDANADTGGDTEQPETGYTWNVARWGGLPQGQHFTDRITMDGEPWSGVFGATPLTYRSGADFRLLFHGTYLDTIEQHVTGDTNDQFEAGETWIMAGPVLWRNRGYDLITYAGAYEVLVRVRFAHSLVTDRTTVTLVYPLDNYAHAALYDVPYEEPDFISAGVNSIHEALWDLQVSADDPPGSPKPQYRPLMADWAFQEPTDHLNPAAWRCTFLFGTGLEENSGYGVAHTEAWPNVVQHDFNGDGLVSATDELLLTDYIAGHDGEAGYDDDGVVNGTVSRVSFASLFSVHDADYDGLVTADGFPSQAVADYDNDGDVDLADVQAMQHCFTGAGETLDPLLLENVGCLDAFDGGDLDIDLDDYSVLLSVLTGPG